MNRREFLRSLVAASVLGATGIAGITELVSVAQKVNPQQNSANVSNAINPTTETTSGTSQSAQITTSTSGTIISQQTIAASSSSSSTSNVSAPAGYFPLAPLSSLAGKTYEYFQHPTHGYSILVSYNGSWNAFSATCTHAPCTVGYQASTIFCPCHGGEFNPNNGSVTRGPPPHSLLKYNVLIQNVNVYVSN